MPIAPPPYLLRCKHCGWSATQVPKSDVLIGSDEQCPRCSHPALTRETLTGWQSTMANWMKKIIR